MKLIDKYSQSYLVGKSFDCLYIWNQTKILAWWNYIADLTYWANALNCVGIFSIFWLFLTAWCNCPFFRVREMRYLLWNLHQFKFHIWDFLAQPELHT